MSSKTFKVRPSPSKLKDGPFQAMLSEQHLLEFGRMNQTSAWVLGKRPVPVLLWREAPQSQKSQMLTSVGRVILLTDTVRHLAGLALGDEVKLAADGDEPKDASEVVVTFTDAQNVILDTPELLKEVEDAVRQCSFIACEQRLIIKAKSDLSLTIHQINRSFEAGLYRVVDDTETIFLPSVQPSSMTISRQGIGGLERALSDVDEKLQFFDVERVAGWNPKAITSFFLLLTGPSGCGKSMMLDAISRLKWPKVYRLQPNAKGAKRLPDMLKQVNQLGRALVLIDDLSRPAHERAEALSLKAQKYSDFAAEILGWKQQLLLKKNCRVLLIAAATSEDEIDEIFIKWNGFNLQVRLGMPNTSERNLILRTRFEYSADKETFFQEVARSTPAYSGGDLEKLSIEIHCIRLSKLSNKENSLSMDWITCANMALKVVKPTSMRGLLVEVPETRFSDIGGQTALKNYLKEELGEAMYDAKRLAEMSLKPTRGLLMYGPPGCSKTLVARAVATEFGVNFLLVNAGELIGSYVGESEKRIRELFRRARDASPCVVFFDEFDALGKQRSDSHQGLNIIQTLLTEFNGVKAVDGVFILAATNRPETLDAALLRPGRLNPHIMVGLPDADARRDIIEIRLKAIDKGRIGELDYSSYVTATEGLSGAEVVSFVEKALRGWYREELSTQQVQQLRHGHFESAATGLTPSISLEEVKRYEAWGRSMRV